MIPLPSVKPQYQQEELDKLSPVCRLAAYYGVQPKFLYFAEPEYLNDKEEMYSIHKFASFNVVCAGGDRIKLYSEDQFKNALDLINNGDLWSSSTIIINAPNYVFNGAKDTSGLESFLSHLLCSLAYRVQQRKAPSVEVNFLEIMQIDHTKGYHIKPRHVLIWGPCTEHFNAYDCNRTIQFLFSFRNHTKILLTSTPDLGAFLEKFHLSMDAVSYVFNLETGLPQKQEIPYSRKYKREKKVKNVALSI